MSTVNQVFVVCEGAELKRHENYEFRHVAEQRAYSLAERHPGKRFFVLRLLSEFRVGDPVKYSYDGEPTPVTRTKGNGEIE